MRPMQTADEIVQIVRRFIRDDIAQDCDEAKLDDNVSLLDSGILDSFGIMSLLAFIEEDFQVKIPAHEIEPSNFETLASIAGLVARHL